jgi:hypothetical protein
MNSRHLLVDVRFDFCSHASLLGDGRVYFAKNDMVLIINLKGKRHDDS